MVWQDLPVTQRALIIAGAAGVLVLGCGYMASQALLALGPDPALPSFAQRTGNANSLYGQISKTNDSIREQQRVVDSMDERQEILDGLQDLEAELRGRLPTERMKEEMRRTIHEMANEVPPDLGRVEFQSVTIVEPAEGGRGGARRPTAGGPPVTEVTYKAELTGRMNGIIDYINRVENHQRFMTVRSIRIVPGAITLDADAQEVLQEPHRVSLDIVTYVYDRPEPVQQTQRRR